MLSTFERKFKSLKELLQIVKDGKKRGEKSVFTNGCFDLLHVGHLRYLEKAREKGDFLIIGLNSDTSVRMLKGEGRPFLPEMERAEILSAIIFVDYIVIFSEDTPENLIKELKPDCHVKGGDYKKEDLPEGKIVESYGGEIFIVEYLPGKSTTLLTEDIIRRGQTKNSGFIEV